MVTKKSTSKTLAVDELVGKPKEPIAESASDAVSSVEKEAASRAVKSVDTDEQSNSSIAESAPAASHATRHHSEEAEHEGPVSARPHRIHIGGDRGSDSG